MSNDYFRFKQFTVSHSRCAMKVGTDGVLLGAWARGGRHILDIGTGTGLVALMMAQRYAGADVVAVDIDSEACSQASANVAASPFAGRISVVNMPIQQYAAPAAGGMAGARRLLFDSIVCNPPFFSNALKCPDAARLAARHTDSLPFTVLMQAVSGLLSGDGEASFVIPFNCKELLHQAAVFAGLHIVRQCAVKTVERKAPRRYLVAYARCPGDEVIVEQHCLTSNDGERSEWYRQLTREFYL